MTNTCETRRPSASYGADAKRKLRTRAEDPNLVKEHGLKAPARPAPRLKKAK